MHPQSQRQRFGGGLWRCRPARLTILIIQGRAFKSPPLVLQGKWCATDVLEMKSRAYWQVS